MKTDRKFDQNCKTKYCCFNHSKTIHFQCDYCKSSQQSETDLKIHIENIHRNNAQEKISCKQCEFKFSTIKNLNEHVNLCHRDYFYYFELCDFKNTSEENVKHHKTKYHNFEKFSNEELQNKLQHLSKSVWKINTDFRIMFPHYEAQQHQMMGF